MTTAARVHEDLAGLAAVRSNGRRHVDPTVQRRFQALMRNDFLTPRGAPYKWQEMTATVARAVAGGGAPTVVPVTYTWQQVRSRTGTPAAAGEDREWTFARGQRFSSVLLHSDMALPRGDMALPRGDMALPRGDMALPRGGEVPVPDSSADRPTVLDVSYPGLPKSPAVDLLLMLSWDVITFEMLCTHLATTPALRETGVPAELERITGSWANLRFSGAGTNAVFRNTVATGIKHGYGLAGGRPTAVYGYQCLDCELTVRSGPISQDGHSSYWGKVQVDAETGDLVVAEMTEMIVAVLTGGDGRQVPVQKRRLVRMWVPDGEPGDAAPPVPAAAPGSAPDPQRGESVTPALLADADRHATRIAQALYWQRGSFDDLPGDLGSLASMGFRSLVGTDLPGAHRRVSELQTGLRAWAGGDAAAGAAVRAGLAAHRQTLEGLLAFGQVAVNEATRLNMRETPAVQRQMTEIRPHIVDLLALLERFGD